MLTSNPYVQTTPTVKSRELENVKKLPEAEAIKLMTTAQLRQELTRLWNVTVSGLKRTALVIQELESRGERVTLKSTMGQHLRKIADGVLSPNLVAEAYNQPQLIQDFSRFPVQKQQELIEKPIPTAVLKENGTVDTWMVRVKDMTSSQRKVAIDEKGNPRPVEEQAHLLLEQATKPVPSRIIVDRKSRRLDIRAGSYSPLELTKALAEVNGAYAKPPEGTTWTDVRGKITEEEKRRLRDAARDHKTTLEEFVRYVLKSTGII